MLSLNTAGNRQDHSGCQNLLFPPPQRPLVAMVQHCTARDQLPALWGSRTSSGHPRPTLHPQGQGRAWSPPTPSAGVNTTWPPPLSSPGWELCLAHGAVRTEQHRTEARDLVAATKNCHRADLSQQQAGHLPLSFPDSVTPIIIPPSNCKTNVKWEQPKGTLEAAEPLWVEACPHWPYVRALF